MDHENQDREIKGLLEAMNELGINNRLILTYDQEDELVFENKKVIIKPVCKWMIDN